MLTWKELAVQNKKLNTVNCIRFLKEADVIPNLINIENFTEIMNKIMVIALSLCS